MKKKPIILILFACLACLSLVLFIRHTKNTIDCARKEQRDALEKVYDSLSEEMLYFRNLQRFISHELNYANLPDDLHKYLFEIAPLKQIKVTHFGRGQSLALKKRLPDGCYHMSWRLAEKKDLVDWTAFQLKYETLSAVLYTKLQGKNHMIAGTLSGEYKLEKSTNILKSIKKKYPHIELSIEKRNLSECTHGKNRLYTLKKGPWLYDLCKFLPYCQVYEIKAKHKAFSWVTPMKEKPMLLALLLVWISLFALTARFKKT